MARHRHGEVQETAEHLEALLKKNIGTPAEPRLRFLLELKAHPDSNLKAIATKLEYSDRQTRRWWSQYQSAGLQGLLSGDGEVTADGDHEIDAQRLLDFVNAMPMALDPQEWGNGFRRALVALLDDVDIVLILADLAAGIRREHVGEYKHGVSVGVGGDRPPRDIMSREITGHPGDAMVQSAVASGLPAHKCHAPRTYHYEHKGRYLGSIVLWRFKTNPPIPSSTFRVLESLEPFIKFAILDWLARAQEGRTDMYSFQNAMLTLGTDSGLSAREMDVFSLQVAGMSRAGIAESLNISESTVGKHIASVHRKIGTQNYIEAIGRMFAHSHVFEAQPKRVK